MESARSGVEVLTSSIYGDLGDDPVISMYGYPWFDEVSVMIFIYGDPFPEMHLILTTSGRDLHIWA